jgi:hypothetical protein
MTTFLDETHLELAHGELDPADLDLFGRWTRTVPASLLPLRPSGDKRVLLGAAFECLCLGESIPEECIELGPLLAHLANYFTAHC